MTWFDADPAFPPFSRSSMDLSARHQSVLEALDEAIKHAENNGDCTVYKYL